MGDVIWHTGVPGCTTVDNITLILNDGWSYDEWVEKNGKTPISDAHVKDQRRLAQLREYGNALHKEQKDYARLRSAAQAVLDAIKEKPSDTCAKAVLRMQAVLLGATSTEADRSWPGDGPHENGNYWCQCSCCGQDFVGHKRRTVCRVCANTLGPVSVEEA